MEPKEFVIWLDGFLTANPYLTSLNEEQTRRLKSKLSTVFNKVTPNVFGGFPFVEKGCGAVGKEFVFPKREESEGLIC